MAKIQLGCDANTVDRSEGSLVVNTGLYLTEVTRAKAQDPDKEKNKGPQLMISFEVKEADRPENEQFVGGTFVDFFSLKQQALFRVLGLWDAITGKRVSGDELDTDDILGKFVVVKVKVEKFNGNENSRADRFFPASKWKNSGKPEQKIINTKPSDDEEVTL